MKIALIRHFKTQGNIEKRYIGRTNEVLSKEGKEQINKKTYPKAEIVYSSPLYRCKETANLIYPEIKPTICTDFIECDFGDFENKNYYELKNNSNYIKWLESGGTLPFPNGESTEAFKNRCCEEFDRIIRHDDQNIAIVVHGGTIMAILDRYSKIHKNFYAWQVKNGDGYIIELDKKLWLNGERYVNVISAI